MTRMRSGPQRPGAMCLAGNSVALDEIEHDLGRRPRERKHARSQLRTKGFQDLIRIGLQARIDLAAIAARSAKSHLAGFEQRDLDAAHRKVQGCG